MNSQDINYKNARDYFLMTVRQEGQPENMAKAYEVYVEAVNQRPSQQTPSINKFLYDEPDEVIGFGD